MSTLGGCGDSVNADSDPMTTADPALAPATPPPDIKTCHGAPYPIILSHGMAGFERIGPLNYFFNVAADLRARGETVFESQVSPYDNSTVRGSALAAFVDDTLRTTQACKVNIVAHSQGGLDARYIISTLHYGDRISGVATVGTPHLGTPVADVGLGIVPGFSDDIINGILLGVQGLTSNQSGNPNIRANLQQLSTAYMKQWNAQNLDDTRVKYYSVAGRSNLSTGTPDCAGSEWTPTSGVDVLNPLLTVPASIFPFFATDPLKPIVNDGLVPVASARWGRFLGCVPADHFDEVGQIAEIGADLISGFDHIDLYRRIVTELHSDGF